MTEKKVVDYSAIFDKMDKLKAQVKDTCPNAKDESGIYVLTRESGGFKFAYIGQSVNVLTRLAQHLDGYKKDKPTHIDLSIKKHGLYSFENRQGWKIGCLYFPKEILNEKEKFYVHLYANAGYQLRNKTSGSQGDDKFGISPNKDNRGYREGVSYGEKRAIKRIKEFFDKYLDYSIKPPINKVKERKLKEFEELLKGE